ncbi:MAG TPA: prolipoprotein diacylglyceryl transferase [Candidatus Faecimonas intestinavium]|nr:prolipoprotein diacylglyceryl transferase [Candidatus Faecimonas intestinavium]
MEKVALDLGPIQIYWYSIFIFIGMLVACFLIYKEAKKRGIEEDFLVNLTFNTIIIGIIGARLYYVLFNFSYYLDNPVEIFQIWNGGLAIHGGIIAGLLFIIYYCKKHEVNLWKILDIIVVGLIIAQAIGRWGNFFNSEAYGPITTAAHLKSLGIPQFIIDGMYILGEYRQPTFFYESVWCLFGFLAMLIIRQYKYLKIGQLTSFYLIWYGIIRFIIEAMRTDSLMLGPLKMAQLVSLVFIVSGIIIFIKSTKTNQKELYNV